MLHLVLIRRHVLLFPGRPALVARTRLRRSLGGVCRRPCSQPLPTDRHPPRLEPGITGPRGTFGHPEERHFENIGAHLVERKVTHHDALCSWYVLSDGAGRVKRIYFVTAARHG